MSLTCYEVSIVPAIVVVDGLKVLDELLHHGLHHHAVLALGLRPEQHSTAPLCSELIQEAALERCPYPVREIEDRGLK